jgi:hypothetical protein
VLVDDRSIKNASFDKKATIIFAKMWSLFENGQVMFLRYSPSEDGLTLFQLNNFRVHEN